MANKPKETTRTRSMIGGGTKTVTKSKGVDAQGTMTKSRTVTRSRDNDSLNKKTLSTTKQNVKQKFASGATRKVKSVSGSQKLDNVLRGRSSESKFTATKEKAAAPGLKNKVKSLIGPSHKSGRQDFSVDGRSGVGLGKANYATAKSNVKSTAKEMRKKYI